MYFLILRILILLKVQLNTQTLQKEEAVQADGLD